MKRNHKITAITVSLALLLNVLLVFGIAPASIAESTLLEYPNGGFESGAWGGYPGDITFATTETDPTYVHSGEKSMKLTAEDRNGNFAALGTSGALCTGMDLANKSYAISVWIKTAAFSGTMYVKMPLFAGPQVGSFYDPRIGIPAVDGIQVIGGNVRSTAPYVDDVNMGDTDWTHVIVPIVSSYTGGIDSMHVYFDVTGTGTVWVDDFDIIEYDQPAANSGVINNADFELGAWVENGKTSTETDPQYVHSGLKSMKVTPNGDGDTVISAVESKFQALDFENKNYAFTAWVKTKDFKGQLNLTTTLYDFVNGGYVANSYLYDARINPGIGGIQLIGGNVRPDAPYVDDVNMGTSDWVRVVAPVKSNNPAAIAMHVSIAALGTGTVWIDDLDLVEYTPAIANSGIIRNADMESGTWCDISGTNPVAGVTSETDLSYVHSGLKSLKIAAPVATAAVNGSVPYPLSNALDLTNKKYAYVAWVKTENFSGNFFVQTNMDAGVMHAIGEPETSRDVPIISDANYGTQDWKRIVVPVEVTNPNATWLHTYLGASGTGTIWVDDIDIIEYVPGVDATITGEGTVDIPADVKPGDTVTVEVKPAQGKQLKGGVLYYSIAGSEVKYPLYARVGSMMYTGSDQDDGANSTKFIFAMPKADVQIYADFVDANAANAAQAAENNVKVFGTSYRESSATASAGLQFGSRVQRQLTVDGVAYAIQSYGTLLVREELLEGAIPNTADWEGWLHTADATGASWKKLPATKIMDICDQHIDFAVRLVNFDNYPALKDAGYLAVAYATYAPVDGGEAITLYDAADAACSYNEAVARTEAFESLY